MQKKFTGFIIGGLLLVMIIIWLVVDYNAFVKQDEKVKFQWAEVQSTYQRRLDLIPSLVNTVKGVSEFEQTTLERLVKARSSAAAVSANKAVTPENYKAQSEVQDSVAVAANRVIAIIEDYPELKGTQAYNGLMRQLDGTERRIKLARTDFNEAVANYNKKVRAFPSNISARIFGYKLLQGFSADAGAEKTIDIKF
jgi:LemA protein